MDFSPIGEAFVCDGDAMEIVVFAQGGNNKTGLGVQVLFHGFGVFFVGFVFYNCLLVVNGLLSRVIGLNLRFIVPGRGLLDIAMDQGGVLGAMPGDVNNNTRKHNGYTSGI